MVMEYISQGGLHSFLQRKDINWTWRHVVRFALDAAIGLSYLHTVGIIHRDVKSPNLLVSLVWLHGVHLVSFMCFSSYSYDSFVFVFEMPETCIFFGGHFEVCKGLNTKQVSHLDSSKEEPCVKVAGHQDMVALVCSLIWRC